MAIDVLEMWNFGDPAGSEARFRAAQAGADPTTQAILSTQISRALGLQGKWEEARTELESGAQLSDDPEVKVRYHLEFGRTLCSPAHDLEEATAEDREAARGHYQAAFDLADQAGLGYLAVDALHMFVAVDPDPATQIAADLRAVAYMESSPDPDAKKWEGSLRHNLGYALHLAGRDDEAIDQYRLSLAARERAGNAEGVRIARWMIARSLRSKGDLGEALEMQLALKSELDALGQTDEYVDQEIEILNGLIEGARPL